MARARTGERRGVALERRRDAAAARGHSPGMAQGAEHARALHIEDLTVHANRATARAHIGGTAEHYHDAERAHRAVASAYRLEGRHDVAAMADEDADEMRERAHRLSGSRAPALRAAREAAALADDLRRGNRSAADHRSAAIQHRVAADLFKRGGDAAQASVYSARAAEHEMHAQTHAAAGHPPSAAQQRQPHALKQGKKGGMYYIGPSGRKVYVKG